MTTAKEILDKYVKEEVRGDVGVIAIGRTTGRKGSVFGILSTKMRKYQKRVLTLRYI